MKRSKIVTFLLSMLIILSFGFVACGRDTLVKIEIKDGSFKAEYEIGEQLDLSNAKITITMSGTGLSDIAIISGMVYDFDSSTPGNKTLTVSYTVGDITKTAIFDYKVKDAPLPADILTGITIKPDSFKTEYELNEQLDLSNAKITITMSGTGTSDIAITEEMVTGFDSSAAGNKTLTVSYTIGGVTKTAVFNYTVNPAPPDILTGIIIKPDSFKTEYELNEQLDLSNAKITITMSETGTSDIAITEGMVTGFDSSAAGNKTLTVSYTIGGVTKTAIFNYTVNPAPPDILTGITIKPDSFKTEYELNEELDYSNAKITITMSVSGTSEIAITSIMVYDFDSSTPGDKTLTVLYEAGGITKTATFDYTVNPAPVDEIALIMTALQDFAALKNFGYSAFVEGRGNISVHLSLDDDGNIVFLKLSGTKNIVIYNGREYDYDSMTSKEFVAGNGEEYFLIRNILQSIYSNEFTVISQTNGSYIILFDGREYSLKIENGILTGLGCEISIDGYFGYADMDIFTHIDENFSDEMFFDIISIEISDGSFKRNYFLNDHLDLAGAYLEITRSYGENYRVKITADMVRGFNTSTESPQNARMLFVEYYGQTYVHEYYVIDPNARLK